ncbi:hypothetical protein ACUXK4_002358 [Methylorubrum extorquens]
MSRGKKPCHSRFYRHLYFPRAWPRPCLPSHRLTGASQRPSFTATIAGSAITCRGPRSMPLMPPARATTPAPLPTACRRQPAICDSSARRHSFRVIRDSPTTCARWQASCPPARLFYPSIRLPRSLEPACRHPVDMDRIRPVHTGLPTTPIRAVSTPIVSSRSLQTGVERRPFWTSRFPSRRKVLLRRRGARRLPTRIGLAPADDRDPKNQAIRG